jgi:hypothetical protein
VTVADVTGDSRPDVVSSSDSRGQYPRKESLIVHPQLADGTLGPAATYPLVGVHGVAVLDVTGDGRKDVVNDKNGVNYVYAQTPDGALAPPVRATNLPGTGRPVAADIDADGDDDLVLTWHKSVRVLRQGPAGTFTASALPAEDLGWPPAALVADVDNDGRLDITVQAHRKLAMFSSGGDGGWTRQMWPEPWAASSVLFGLGVGKFGSNAAKHLVAVVHAANGGGEVLVMRPVAGGAGLTVTQRIVLPFLGGTTGEPNVLITDLTNDGRTDVMLDGNGDVRTYVQRPDGKLVLDASRDLVRHTMAFTAADINSDGRTDLLAGDLPGLMIHHAAGGPAMSGDPTWLRDITPAPGATGTSGTTSPSVTFRRPIDPASVTAATVRLVDARTGVQVPGTVAYSADTRTVTVTPSAPLTENTPYRLWLGDIHDTDGVRYPGSSSGFRTGNVRPGPVTDLRGVGGHQTATLSWTLPATPDLDKVVVRMATNTATPPSSPTAGTLVYSGTATRTVVRGLNATRFAFSVWVRDQAGTYSPAATTVMAGALTRSVSATPTAVTYGATTTVRGQLVRRDNATPLAGAPVQLYAKTKGTSTWTLLSTVTSTATGTLAWSGRPTVTRTYRWQYNGAPGVVGTPSATPAVAVRLQVTANLSRTTVARGKQVTLTGKVLPAHPKHRVHLQRYDNGSWRTVKSAVLPASSAYKFTVPTTTRGTHKYRVWKPADTNNLESASATRTLRVT